MRTKVKKAVNETGEFLKFVLKVLQVRYFAVAFSIIFFVLIYFITPYYWSHGVSILIAYMVADLIRIIIIDGNNRFIQFNSLMFSRERNERRHKGHAYFILYNDEHNCKCFFCRLVIRTNNRGKQIFLSVCSNNHCFSFSISGFSL